MANTSRRDEDIFFMPDVHAATFRKGRKIAYVLTFTSFCFFVFFVFWANYAVLDEVTRGDGTIVPSRKVQIVQNLEGGIVSEILVREGDVVQQGDIVMRIDNARASAAHRDQQSQRNVLTAALARLKAELNGTELKFTPEFTSQTPGGVAGQLSLFAIRKAEFAAVISVLENQRGQRKQEVAEAKSRINQLSRSLELAKQERDITRPLVEKGISPRLELIRIERQVTDLSGEIETLQTSMPRLQGAVNEAKQRIEQEQLSRRAKVSDELNHVRSELESITEAVVAGQDTVNRTNVRSPVNGTVKELKHNTVGGVIDPGEDIVEIVPNDDSLLIEARVRPSDRAFLHPGQSAIVKITAYDFSIYGGVKSTLERISASTIKDEEGKSFYRVYLRSNEKKLFRRGKELEIIPGMTVNVEILTGKKSVLDYILKPILKARDSALRER